MRIAILYVYNLLGASNSYRLAGYTLPIILMWACMVELIEIDAARYFQVEQAQWRIQGIPSISQNPPGFD